GAPINIEKFATNNKYREMALDTFSSIRFKKDTALRFQKFSKESFSTHSEALQSMLDFFLYNEISPKESLGPNGRTISNLIKKRFNAMAAMMRNMEKQGILPTKAMLELLFEKSPQRSNPPRRPALFLGGKASQSEGDIFFKQVEEAINIEKDNINLKLALNKNRTEFSDLIGKIHIVKSSFGKPRLELDMAPKDFEKLKLKIQKE